MAGETRCRQVSLTLPIWLLREIDKRRGLTKRSTFIAALLSKALKVEECKKEKASEAPEEATTASKEVEPHGR